MVEYGGVCVEFDRVCVVEHSSVCVWWGTMVSVVKCSNVSGRVQ